MFIASTPVTITITSSAMLFGINSNGLTIRADGEVSFHPNERGDEEFHFCNRLPNEIIIEPKCEFPDNPEFVPLSDLFRQQARQETKLLDILGDIVSVSYLAKAQALKWCIWLDGWKFRNLTGIIRHNLGHRFALDINTALYAFKGSFNNYEAPTPTEDEFRAGSPYIHVHDAALQLRQGSA
jgi:hypothetical protein